MKRNVILMFLVSLMIAGLSGCIISQTPNPIVTLNVNDPPQTFSVTGVFNGPYTWTATPPVIISPSGPNCDYTPVCADVGTFVLRVDTDGIGICAGIHFSRTWTITVVDQPVAEAGPDNNIDLGQIAVLDGSASTDPCNGPLTYEWTISSKPQFSTAIIVDPTAVKPTFTPDKHGTYVIQLIVYCGGTPSVADTVTLTV